jgi:IclR family transcriptional regulator, KDG regulon repressor
VSSADGTIARTMRVLSALCHGGPRSLKPLSDEVELSSATVLRFLRILQECGYVEQLDDRTWRATLEVWRLGSAVLSEGGWGRQLDDIVELVARQTGETCIYAVYDSGTMMYLARSPAPNAVRTHIELGASFPAWQITSGRAVLAHLTQDELERDVAAGWSAERWTGPEGERLRDELVEIASRGYVSAPSTTWPGVWGIAAPVFGSRGRPVGALGVSMPPGRNPDDEIPIAHLLVEQAARLSQLVTARGPHRSAAPSRAAHQPD